MRKMIISILVIFMTSSSGANALTQDEQKAQRLVHAIMSRGVTAEYAKGLGYTGFQRRGKCLYYLEAEHNGAFQGGYLVDVCKNKATGTN